MLAIKGIHSLHSVKVQLVASLDFAASSPPNVFGRLDGRHDCRLVGDIATVTWAQIAVVWRFDIAAVGAPTSLSFGGPTLLVDVDNDDEYKHKYDEEHRRDSI